MELIVAVVVALLLLGLLWKLATGAIKLVGMIVVVVLLVWFITASGGVV